MSRPAITAEAFALTAGEPSDIRHLVHVDPVPGAAGRRLLVSVEPLEPSARGLELAALALATLREAFAGATDLPPAQALTRAFAVANDALMAENRPLTGCCWQRRVHVGATAVAIDGRHVTIAQVPPTQALILQDRRLYAFPDLASWRSDYVPVSDQPEPEALGYREGTQPCLFRTVAAPGDLIFFCSSTLARILGRDATAVAMLSGESVLRGDLGTALERLGGIAAAQELDDVHVAGIAIGRVSGGRGRLPAPSRHWLGTGWSAVAPRLPALNAPQAGQVRSIGVNGVNSARVSAVGRRGWTGVGVPLDQPLAPAFVDARAAAEEWTPRQQEPIPSGAGASSHDR